MSTILVLGATGKTGRRTSSELLAAGHTVRGGARSATGHAEGVEPARFDWEDPATWGPALRGADAVYLVPPALRLDYADVFRAFAEQAVAAGVGHGVMLSARGANLAVEGAAAQAEAAVQEVFPTWGIVRPTWFAQNFTESFFRPGIEEQGILVAPTGDGREPFIDAADIAAVAAAVLTRPELAGEAYDISGPEALTFAEAAEQLGAAAGGRITHVDAEPAAWEAEAVAAGLPAEYAALLGMLLGLIRSGDDAHLSGGVQRALGREPGTFAAWAAREATELQVGSPA